jgi:hypothetical protein
MSWGILLFFGKKLPPVFFNVDEVEYQIKQHNKQVKQVEPRNRISVVQQFVNNAENISQDNDNHKDRTLSDNHFRA